MVMEELQYLVSSFSGDMTFVYFVQTNMALVEPVMHVGTWCWFNQLWPLAAVYCPSSATLTRACPGFVEKVPVASLPAYGFGQTHLTIHLLWLQSMISIYYHYQAWSDQSCKNVPTSRC